MRLCGRSAKDAEPRDRNRIRREYSHHLTRLCTEAGVDPALPKTDVDPEIKMRALGQVVLHSYCSWLKSIDSRVIPDSVQVNLLKATSGADVMAMLLSSERVYVQQVSLSVCLSVSLSLLTELVLLTCVSL